MNGGIELILKENKDLLPHLAEGKDLPMVSDLAESREYTANGGIEKPDMAFIERTTRAALIEMHDFTRVEYLYDNGEGGAESDVPENKGLTDEEKALIKEETGWSDEIIDNIQNMKQYEILKNAGLIEAEINGRKCLIKENIDLDYRDSDGISNRDRIARGLSPLDSKTGKPLELHHLGQKMDSPLVELTAEEHRTGEYEDGKKNYSLWHDNTRETEVHGEGNSWPQERKEHWSTRLGNLLEGNE
ncbi:HNH/ENDO VII family nuclease [Pectobacterium polaris]|uniref:HNH/ENDO VII family nuclease n=1 Tax=Pectobacterium polaris TaxID=2042057 RepID=UPI001583EBDD|nr:HNH/ENDO VII family nuclease [Pectobacterium polaris]